MSRQIVIAANWKMHKTSEQARAYIQQLSKQVELAPNELVFLAVPATSLEAAASAAAGTSVVVGAQNMHDAEKGAFTGEISANMLKAAGAQFVVLGHSERRHVFGEDDAFINRKLHRAIDSGIRPIVCIGETLEQRKSGATERTLKQQIEQSLKGITAEQLTTVIVAYEPVWAIGTGETATPEMAQEAHAFIRKTLAELWNQDAANKVVIQYGGSAKPANAAGLMAQADIDGLLIGGAALEADGLLQIINNTHPIVSES